MYKRNNRKGVITVLVSLLLVGVLSVGTVVLEAGRLQAAKTQLAEANISAATSMIAAYDADLYERYGLLAIDTERFTEERAMDYVTFNADQATGYQGNRLSRMYTVDSVELTGMYNLTYPSILKRQILSRAKYHIVPQDNVLNVYTMDSFFADFQNKCQYVADQLAPAANGSATAGEITDIPEDVQRALTSLYMTYYTVDMYDAGCDVTLSRSTVQLLPSATGVVKSEAPAEDINDIKTMLTNVTNIMGSTGSVLSDSYGTVTNETDVSVSVSFAPYIQNYLYDVISAADVVSNTQYVAGRIRSMAQGYNTAINVLKSDEEANLLLNSYIADYFSNRNYKINTYAAPAKGTSIGGTMDNVTFASACVEYVFGGNSSEKANQEVAYGYLQGIRLIYDLYAVMTGSAWYNPYNAYSVAAHMAWADYESIVDMELLTKYNLAVPLNKNRQALQMQAAASIADAYAANDPVAAMAALGIYDGATLYVTGSYAMGYKDSLSVALWFVPNTQKMMRIADLIQLEMRYREQYVENKTAVFLMSNQNTYCRVKSNAKFVAALPMISLDRDNATGGVRFQSVKYAGY